MGPGEGRRAGRGRRQRWWPWPETRAPLKVPGDRCPRPSLEGQRSDRGPQAGPAEPLGTFSPPGSWPNFPHPVMGWGPQGLGKAAPGPPHASPQTHSHTTVPCPGASPCQPGQGAALVPAPSGQGDPGGQSGLRGYGMGGAADTTERGRRREGASAGKRLAPPLAQATATLAGWVGPAWARGATQEGTEPREHREPGDGWAAKCHSASSRGL